MPSLTPPSRVKKAWRIPGLLPGPSARTLRVIMIEISLEPGGHRQARRGQCQGLEQTAHLRRIDQAPEAAFERGALRRGRPCHQCREPRLGAKRREESA